MRLLIFLLLLLLGSTSHAQINLRLYSENTRTGAIIYAENNESYPVSLQFTFTLENMVWRNYGQDVFVVPAGSVRYRVTELEQTVAGRAYRFSYRYKYVKGDVNGKGPDSTIVVDLPFAKGKGYQVM